MEHTRHAMILAAGLGSRLAADEGHKILAQVGGRPLIDYHINNFARLGVSDLTVVTGYRHEALAETLENWPLPEGMRLHVAFNPNFQGRNGISVLAGVDAVCGGEPFWLTMGDHIIEPGLFDDLAERFEAERQAHWQGSLMIDYKLDTIFDMPDANKLYLEQGGLTIGKDIYGFSAIDVGLFWCGRGFVQALRAEFDRRGDCDTSDAVSALHAQKAFWLWDIGERQWQDVDTAGAREHAEKLIAAWRASER
ncbi:MAG: NTP transferase domain-containing protein [Bradymonadaceae bacterium]|nr:NTP transferase domain-containing protein [Lujinxingiaceae bacterium]